MLAYFVLQQKDVYTLPWTSLTQRAHMYVSSTELQA